MPAGKRISLGAAFFGCDPAKGHYSPGQQVPDAWLLSLADYAGVLSGVFSSCRAGREWVLASARTAALTIDMSTAGPDEQAWRRRLDALQGHLSTRAQHQGDEQGTSLYILCTREQSTTPAFQLLPGMLAAAGGAVDMLFIKDPRGSDAPESDVLSALVRDAAPGLGNLDVLCVQCGHCVLPAPALLPKLKVISMKVPPGTADNTVEAVLGSIRPYLGQLVHLTVCHVGPHGLVRDSFPWYLLFPPVAAATATAAAPAACATNTAAAASTATAAGTDSTAAATATAATGAAAPTNAATDCTAAGSNTTAPSAGPSLAQATPAAAANTAAASTAAASTATAATAAAASTATAAAPKLIEFCTTYDLNDTLLTSLLHHAPNLTKVSVGRIALRGDYSKDTHWYVCALDVLYGVWGSGLVGLYAGMYLPTLVRLPMCDHDGQLVVGGFKRLNLVATTEEGLDESVAERLCDFVFDVQDVCVSPADSLPLADQPAAFKSTLQQLSEFSTVGGTVVTRGWHWTVDMLRIAAECVPTLDHLRMQVCVDCQDALADEHLTHIMQLADHHFVGVFSGLSLQSDQHSSAKWPFAGVMFRGAVNVADLVRLPRPDETSDAVLWCCKLVIDSRSITEVGVQDSCDWLQHAQWTHPDIIAAAEPTMTITLRCPQDDPAMQREQLQVLRAMQLDSKPEIQGKVTVVLDGWQMTHTAMDVLREGLPEWASQIDFTQATFTLQPETYTHLAQCVPVRYTTWHTGLEYQSPVYKTVTEGISARRQAASGLGFLLVTVHSAPGSWVYSNESHYTVRSQHPPGGEWEDEWGDEWHL